MHKSFALAALTLLSASMATAKPTKMCPMALDKRFVPDCESQGKTICGECGTECCDKKPSPPPEKNPDDPIMCTMVMPVCKEDEVTCGRCNNQCCPKKPTPPEPCSTPKPLINCVAGYVPGGRCGTKCVPKKKGKPVTKDEPILPLNSKRDASPEAAPDAKPVTCTNKGRPNCAAKGQVQCGFCGIECCNPDELPTNAPPTQIKTPIKRDAEPEAAPEPIACLAPPKICPAPQKSCGICGVDCCEPGDPKLHEFNLPGPDPRILAGGAETTPTEDDPPKNQAPENKPGCENAPIPKCKAGYQRCGFCGELCYPGDEPCPRYAAPEGYEPKSKEETPKKK